MTLRLSPLGWRGLVAALLGILALAAMRLPATPTTLAPQRPASDMAQAGTPTPEAIPPLLPDPASALPLDADAARRSNAGVPLADPAPVVAQPFRFAGDAAALERAQDCLALAAWHEAGDDPAGERAVVQVVLNRARHPAFPAEVCAVAFQGSQRRTGCQFTFTCDGALSRIAPPAALARARAIALAALRGAVDGQVGLATHYHADYVVPRWRDGLVKIARQGAHLFYRWPGHWGSPAAMRSGSGGGMEPTIPALAVLSAAHGAPSPTLSPTAVVPDATAAGADEPPRPDFAGAREFQIDPAAPPGSFALRALDLCGRAADCRIAGRVTQEIAFLYVRRGGGDGAWWDCARFPRRESAQCLPTGAALERLLAAG